MQSYKPSYKAAAVSGIITAVVGVLVDLTKMRFLHAIITMPVFTRRKGQSPKGTGQLPWTGIIDKF